MKQSCSLWAVWSTWLGLPLLGLAAAFAWSWWAGLLVLVAGAAGQVLYLRSFPRISHWMGYGSVSDRPAGNVRGEGGVERVRFYTANLCPFCPIVRSRLRDLQQRMHFEIEEIDVTFKPQVITSKGLWSVPVIEAGGQTLVGNATSEQLAALIQPGPGRPREGAGHAART